MRHFTRHILYAIAALVIVSTGCTFPGTKTVKVPPLTERAEPAKYNGAIAVVFTEELVNLQANSRNTIKYGDALTAALENSCRQAYQQVIPASDGAAGCVTLRFTLVDQRFHHSISGYFRPTQRAVHELALRIEVIAPGSTEPCCSVTLHGSSNEERTRVFLYYSSEFDMKAITHTIDEIAGQVSELLLLGLAES